uniref:Golgin subfamily A member 3-like n=1 Tax=Saccoglossus kowalevskii TaxID=10224 RepID=A0ABM0LZK6_SACKO|nr:PREDICTED: golgin subfamily A member 3-like [Saccoglossus kowalevskii]
MDPVYISFLEEEVTHETDNTIVEETFNLDSFDVLVSYDTDIEQWRRYQKPYSTSEENTVRSEQTEKQFKQFYEFQLSKAEDCLEANYRNNQVATRKQNFDSTFDPKNIEVKGHMSEISYHSDAESVVSGSGVLGFGGDFGVHGGEVIKGRGSPASITSNGSSILSGASYSFSNYNHPGTHDTSFFPQRDLHHLADQIKNSPENVKLSSSNTTGNGDGIGVGNLGTEVRRASRDSALFQPIRSPIEEEEEVLGDIIIDGEPVEQIIARDISSTEESSIEPQQQSVEELTQELSDLEKEIKRLVVDIYSEKKVGLSSGTLETENISSENNKVETLVKPVDNSSSGETNKGGDSSTHTPGDCDLSIDVYSNPNIDITQLVNSVIAETMRSSSVGSKEERPQSAGSSNDMLQALSQSSGFALQQSSIGNPNFKSASAEQISAVIAKAEKQYRGKLNQHPVEKDSDQAKKPKSQTPVKELAGDVHEPPTKLPAPEYFKPLQMPHEIPVASDSTPVSTKPSPEQHSITPESHQTGDKLPIRPTPTTVKMPSMALIGQNTGLAVQSAVASKFSRKEESTSLFRSPVESVISSRNTESTLISGKKSQEREKSKKSRKSGKRGKHLDDISVTQSVETMSNASDTTNLTSVTLPSRGSSVTGSLPHTPKSDGKSKSFFGSIFSWGGNKEGEHPPGLPPHLSQMSTYEHGDHLSIHDENTHHSPIQDVHQPVTNETTDSGIGLSHADTPNQSESSSLPAESISATSTPIQYPKHNKAERHSYGMSGQRALFSASPRPKQSFEIHSDSSSSDIYTVMREKAMLEGKLESMASEAESAIHDRAQLLSEVAALKMQLRNQHSTADSALQEKSALVVDLETLKQNRVQLEHKILELQNKIEVKDNDIQNLTDELKSSQENNEELFHKLEQIRVNVTTKETSITMLKDKISTLQHELVAAHQEHSHSAGEMASLETDIQTLVNAKEWFQDQLQQAQGARAKLQQELMRAHSNAVSQGTMIENLKTENARIRQQLTETQQKALQEKEMLAKHLEAIEADMMNREATFEQMYRERQAAEEAVSLKMQRVEDDKNQLSSLIASSVQIEQQLEKSKKQLYVKEAALAVLEEEKTELVKRLTLAQESITSRDLQIESLESKCIDLEVQMKNLKTESFSHDELIQQLRNEKIALESALATAHEEKRSIDLACTRLQTDMGRVEKSFKTMKQDLQVKITAFEDVDKERNELKVKLEETEKELTEHKKTYQTRNADVASKTKLVEELKSNKILLEGEVAVMKKRVQMLENNYDTAKLEKENLEKDLISAEESVSDAQSELQTALEGKAHLEGQIEMMNMERETYAMLIEENNRLKQTLAEQQSISHREVADNKARILRLSSDLNHAQKSLKEKQKSYDSAVSTLTIKLKEAVEVRQRTEVQLQAVQNQVVSIKVEEQEKLESEVQTLKVELETTQIRKHTLETELHELQMKMVEDTNNYTNKIAKLERELQAMKDYSENQRRAEDFNRKMALELERERGRLAGVKQSHDALKHHTSVLETALARRESSLTEMVGQVQKLKREREDDEQKINERLFELEELLNEEKTLNIEIKKKLTAESNERSKLQRQSHSLSTDLEQLQQDVNSKSNEIHHVKEELSKIKESERQQRTEKEQLQLHLKGSRLQVERLKRQVDEKASQEPVLHDRIQTSKSELETLRVELSAARKEKFMFQAKVTELKGILKATVQQNKV